MGSRAELLPEEQAVGSDDPEAQAAAILAESEERTEDPEATAESPPRPLTERRSTGRRARWCESWRGDLNP